jgi:hypothetical protein
LAQPKTGQSSNHAIARSMPDSRTMTDDQLEAVVANHQRLRATDRPLFREAVKELNRRHGGELDLDKTLDFVRRAAAKGRFVSYGDVAKANGANWNKVRRPMNKHLWALVSLAHSKGWPMLSAIVVNQQNLATGAMEPSTLDGFIRAARDLGYEVLDGVAFLEQQQEACFAWGHSQAARATPPRRRSRLAEVFATLDPLEDEFPEIEDRPPEPFEL